ncbi:hypothetical protein DFH05DRAFT_1469384 [Lentinula detonsa]|uniref:Uncharacterized protein n=1 Tax=Lentinula detonsa TaxID=2804962 RepID=A0A9W8PC17_9AGAR|nr:hypothetical protein DFH05DRAFT_1469384 [Lentinula detonsa]
MVGSSGHFLATVVLGHEWLTTLLTRLVTVCAYSHLYILSSVRDMIKTIEITCADTLGSSTTARGGILLAPFFILAVS